MQIPQKTITLAQLRRNNGDRGLPKWVVYQSIVYDVTNCPRWQKEMHENLHFAGQDLTEEMAESPHTQHVLGFPCVKVVGRFEEDLDGANNGL